MKWSIPDRIISRGRKYMMEGRVHSLTKDDTRLKWYAEVIGSEVYYVELDGTTKEKDVCTCPYWLDHGYCKHTVAVELAIKDKGMSRVITETDAPRKIFQPPSDAEVFTDGFIKLQEKENTRDLERGEPLKLDVIVESVETLSFYPEKAVICLHLKVGSDVPGSRTYVVKNLAEFFKAYENQQGFQINNNHHFQIRDTSFHKKDKELLDACLAIHKANQMLVTGGVQQQGRPNARYLMLSQDEAKHMLTALTAEQRLLFKLPFGSRHKITFQAGRLPLVFSVKRSGDGYLLVIDTSHIDMYWETYGWVLSKSNLYELTHEQHVHYQTLMNLMKRLPKPEVFYTKDQLGELFSYVIPALATIGHVEVSDIVADDMIHAPIKTDFYMMLQDGMLSVRVDFSYADVVFSTDSAVATERAADAPIVVRNTLQEGRAEQLLDQLGFRLGKTAYQKPFPQGQYLYRFFSSELAEFEKLGQVHLTDELEQLYLSADDYQPQVNITEHGSWLDIRFDISGIDDKEVNQVLKSLLKRQDFHQLENGQIIAFDSETFQQTSDVLRRLRRDLTFRGNHLAVPSYRGIQVQDAFGQLEEVDFSGEFKQMVEDLANPSAFPLRFPETLQATLRSYQEAGVRWLKMLSSYQFGGILADDMGLGKTIQTIAYLLSEKEEGNLQQPVLIVTPASLLYNWQIECRRFAPELSVTVSAGSKQQRDALIEENPTSDIFITSYSMLRQDIERYRDMSFHCLVLDEAQAIKNAATKTFHAVKEIQATHRFALSGTPIENNLEELWALFNVLMPGFFPPMRQFKALDTEDVAQMVRPFVLRREKKRVLKDLPDKMETNLYSSLTEEQKTVYLAYLKQMQETVGAMSEGEFNRNRISILAGLTRLRQICCDPRLFLPDYSGQSGKLEQLKEIIPVAIENGRRILLFSQFTSMLSLIEAELASLGIDVFYLRGSTKSADRQKMVDQFNQGDKAVFLISLKAGSTGLNLTGADTVILYDLWWNPAVEEQAAGRAHRIGQQKKVEVWRLIAEGTIEEKINQLQQGKRELFEKVLQATDTAGRSQLSEQDIRDILMIGSADDVSGTNAF